MYDQIQFSSVSEFLAMGGYAFNVWSVYLLFLVFLLINILLPLQRKKRIIQEQRRRLTRNDVTEITVSVRNDKAI
jgi:heme exporter protein D